MTFITELEKIFNLYGNTKGPQQAKQSKERKTELQDSCFPHFRLYLKATVIKTHKQAYRSVEQDRKLRNKPMHLWSNNL